MSRKGNTFINKSNEDLKISADIRKKLLSSPSLMTRKERFTAILQHWQTALPNVATELHYGSPFQLLVATILSAQCTDRRVNLITPKLFDRFPDASAMAQATEEELLALISSVSYPNAKTKHLKRMAQQLVAQHGGEVPDSSSALEALPGVGRKTANVVLATCFKRDRIAVDTHVFRVAHRLKLVSPKATTPTQVEQQLYKYIPKGQAANAHHWLLLHGRYICQSRKPKCSLCPFETFCPSKQQII